MVRQPPQAGSIISNTLRQSTRRNGDSRNTNLPKGKSIYLPLGDHNVPANLDPICQKQRLGRAILRELLTIQAAPLDRSHPIIALVWKSNTIKLLVGLLKVFSPRHDAQ